MLKHHADFIVITLAKTPRNEDLDAHGKAHCQGGEDEIIKTRHHRGTQFVGAKVAEKSCISESDDSLRKVAQHNWICYAPDFLVGDGGFNHGAKVGNSSAHLNQFSQFSHIFLSQYPEKMYFCLCQKKELQK